jgi:cell division septation protein DedD
MGFFSKKKNADGTSSILSESEIQKKLYGEFSGRDSHVAIGEREHFKEPPPAPLVLKESSREKDLPHDLFSAQKEVLSESSPSPRYVAPGQKPNDPASHFVARHDFEKKSALSSSASSGSDSYARFPYNRPREDKGVAFMGFLNGFSEKMGEFSRFIIDPRQVAIRRVFYWGAAILVVFLLFWGVNALNSQREEAMRSRYKIPGEAAQVKAPEAVVPAVIPAASVTERPVVITPAPVRVSKQAASTPEPYVIQVVTYPSVQDADSIVKNLKSSGFRAFVKESARPSGRVFYMVLIGGFRTAAEAQSQLLKFKGQGVARPFQDAFVRTNRS